MRSNPSNRHSLFSASTVVHNSQRTIPFLPGLVLLGLAVVLLVAPRLVLGALAFCLLTLGLFLCYVAYKFVSLRKQLSTLTRGMETSIYSGSFRASKPEGDVIEVESGKIIYH